jgi:hypothetical protein
MKKFMTNKVTRIEIINHAKNDLEIGRILVLKNCFKNCEIELQDDNKTLKIFIT